MSVDIRRINEVIDQYYAEGYPDYHLPAIVLTDETKKPLGRILDGDSIIFCCRRGEREIQLTRAFVDPNFNEHPVKKYSQITFVPLTLYHESFSHLPIAFPPIQINHTLGEVVSRYGLKQVRIAESEKFNHVTFFFNGGNRQPFPGEVDIQVPTRKGVAFDEFPELSIEEVTSRAVDSIRGGQYHLVVVNFANGDIIGHIENREANLSCAQAIDQHLGMILNAAVDEGYVVAITADHGVFEQMIKPDGEPSLGHTRNPVPFILVGLKHDGGVSLRSGGKLANVAPTILDLMGLPKPQVMTCKSLIHRVGEYESEHPGSQHHRVVLVILDGCGIGSHDDSNPLFQAHTPVLDRLMNEHPCTELDASGEAVGLLKGKNGNSESGHMNISAGRVVTQDDVRIDVALRDNSFFENEAFMLAINNAKNNHALHLLTLLSKGSSHGSMDYALALLRLARKESLEKVFVHLIFDGRSTDPNKTPTLLKDFDQKMRQIGIGRVVTGIGRGFALDRDGNYREKTKVAYDALVFGKGREVQVPSQG